MFNFLLFVSPFLLIILVGILIRVRGKPETAGRRDFLFLVWTGIGSLAIILFNWTFPGSGFGFATVLLSILPAVLILILLQLREWRALPDRAKILISSIVILMVMLAVGRFWIVGQKNAGQRLETIFFGMALLSISVVLFVAWKWGSRFPFLLGAVAILYLTFFNALELGSLSLPSDSMPGWWNAIGALAYLAIPGITIPVMAMLLASVLGMFRTSKESGFPGWGSIAGQLLLFMILFGCLLYTYRWLWLWDGMDDGIRWIFMLAVSGIAAVSAGMVMIMTAVGWKRWAGLAFVILVIGSIYRASAMRFGIAEGVTNYTVTEARAAQIRQAIEAYHAKTGWYPLELQELVPGEMLRIPLPMIIPAQGWCYQGGSNYYRLGAVYREHWSSPYLGVQVYASAGNPPEGPWECDAKLAELREQNELMFNTPPTPMPLSTSEVSVPRVVVQPILRAKSLSVGKWSPDGEYLVFGLTEYFMDEVEHVTIDLRFLDAKTGEICQPSQSQWTVQKSDGLRDHSAWLPDGRLLYVTEAGEMVAFQPCTDGAENLAGRFPVTLTHVVAADAQSGRVLLKNLDGYWLMDGSSLELRKIAGVPAETYWSWYDWSPGGGRLAISQMSGPAVEDEAALSIVDWATGQVEQSLPLEDASDANLPIVEWLTRDELLLHGNTLTVMDFRSDPPARTDVLKDIFLLDIAYPLDVWGMDSVRSIDGEGYYIGVQVNHPNNKDAYLYSSEKGEVEVFHHDVSTLIFFNDGQWLRLLKWEDEPTYRDEYEMVWMDQPGRETRLKVEGHVPRAHPQMIPRYLPGTSQLVFSSSQGISLVSIPDGEMLGFWELASGLDFFNVIPSPNEEALIVEAGGDGLYYIPLPGR